jgi:hypothetical protein
MAIKTEKQDNSQVDVDENHIVPKNEISSKFPPFRFIARIGIFIFRLLFRPQITWDNFAIVGLAHKSISGPKFSEDNHLYNFKKKIISDFTLTRSRGPLDTTDGRQRYMSLKQQAVAGWCIVPIFMLVMVVFTGKSLSENNENLFNVLFFTTFFSGFLSFWVATGLIIRISGQIYDE